MKSLVLLADAFVSPVETYFSFVILGLMVTIGFVIWRAGAGKRARRLEEKSLEAAMLDAVAMAKQRALEKQMATPEESSPNSRSQSADIHPESKEKEN